MLSLFLSLLDRIIALVKLRTADREQLFKQVVEPLFIQIQPVVDDYRGIFLGAEKNIYKAKSKKALVEAISVIKENRDKLLHARRQVTEFALAIKDHVSDKHVVSFADKVARFFYSTEVDLKRMSSSNNLIELCDELLEEKKSKDEILGYINTILRQSEERWIAIAATYAAIRISSMTPKRYLD